MGRRGRAAIRSATSPSAGPSGTASTATTSAASGRATAARSTSSPRRLTGSSDLYAWSGRQPYASINFVTCHDGFTLHDLVSYNDKHNEANGEDNRDGANDNNSWNCGAEGPTDDPEILALRERQKRNLIATLLLSQGVPMILAGDELSHTQNGNNNTYCQDNELSWLNWDLDDRQQKFLDFVRKVAQICKEQPVFQRRKFFQGRSIRGSGITDISWFGPDGQDMSDEAWSAGFVKCLGVRLAGDLIGDVDEKGEKLVGETLLLILNAHHEPIPFTLPVTNPGHSWESILDTADPEAGPGLFGAGQQFPLHGRSLALLRIREETEATPQLTSLQADALRKEARQPATSVPPLDKPFIR